MFVLTDHVGTMIKFRPGPVFDKNDTATRGIWIDAGWEDEGVIVVSSEAILALAKHVKAVNAKAAKWAKTLAMENKT